MQEIVDRLAATDESAQIAKTLVFPYLNHAAEMYASGYATRDDIDAGMRFGCGYPIGPLTLIDALGAATVVAELKTLHAKTGDPLHEPAQILQQQSDSNEGFYTANADADDGAAEQQMRHDIKTVGVVGTGTMASGIVEVFAKAGYDVVYVGRGDDKLSGVVAQITKSLDRAISRGRLEESEKDAIVGRLHGATSRDALADADLIIEAIAEDLDIKLELFKDLDRIAKPGAILATTTSSLSIGSCAQATSRPADVVGIHFFNPAPIMKLVEVVSTDATSADVSQTAKAISAKVGKHPVSCGDRAGFIVNALLFPYLNDAIKLHETGIELQTIDDALKAAKFPMGPFELLDVVGNDVSLAIQETLVETFGHDGWQPAAMLREKVAAGALGRKTGEGFHNYAK